MLIRILRLLILLVLILGLSAAAPNPSDDGLVSSQALVPCGADPQVDALLSQTSAEDWSAWIARLSGLDPVLLNGETTTIQTRYSYAMFRDQPNARGYEYVLARLQNWYPAAQIEEDAYTPAGNAVWKNIVLTLPGATHPDEIVILSAHLDSTSDNPDSLAPGAEDNASGSAALLEAARIFRTHRFARTIRMIWFTGEEQGLLGSKAYVLDHSLSGLVGVINLDMYGYDLNQDGCFELHIGTMAASAPIGACFRAAASAYSPALKVDAIDTSDMRYSDHNSFWTKGIGAVEILENFHPGAATDACGGYAELSPYYHKTTDTLDHINLSTGFAITRAGLAAAAGLAAPLEACFSAAPHLTVLPQGDRVALSWTSVAGAERYRIFRSDASAAGRAALCSAEWIPIHDTSSLAWSDTSAAPEQYYAYRVEAVSALAAGCVSAPSACVVVKGSLRTIFIPWVDH
jgi:hypothetical protein